MKRKPKEKDIEKELLLKKRELKSLREELKRKTIQVETLSQVSKTITSSLYLKEILDLVVTMTAEMMNSKICSIMLLDESKQELVIMATQSLSEEYKKKPNLKIGESISGRAVEEKSPITVIDVTEEKGYRFPEIAKRESLCSMLAVPMIFKNRAIGVVNSYTSKKHKFSEEEINVLQAIANQAAVSIENTKLLDKAAAMEEALKTRKQIERAKGILMREKGISEGEAFKLIQRQSMNTRKSMREIAEAIILTSEIK